MKKSGWILAALGAIAVAAPSIASSETVVIKGGGYHHGYGARAEYREHRDHGWHRGWHHDHDRVTGMPSLPRRALKRKMAPRGAIFFANNQSG